MGLRRFGVCHEGLEEFGFEILWMLLAGLKKDEYSGMCPAYGCPCEP